MTLYISHALTLYVIELLRNEGKQFDPKFAEIMLRRIDLDTEYAMKENASPGGEAVPDRAAEPVT